MEKMKLFPDSYRTWIVICPKGKASGWYNIAGQQHEVAGEGYHDHTYGLVPTVDGYMWIPNFLGENTKRGHCRGFC